MLQFLINFLKHQRQAGFSDLMHELKKNHVRLYTYMQQYTYIHTIPHEETQPSAQSFPETLA